MRLPAPCLALISLSLFACPGPSSAQTSDASDEQIEFFETRIRPVLVKHCYACHNSHESAEGGLAVDHRDGLTSGGDGGVIVTAGDPSKSRLIAILKHEIEGLEMPEDGPRLDDAIIRDFEKWIAEGARDPRTEPPSADQIAETSSWDATLRRRTQWWSFQPIVDPPVPDSLERDSYTQPLDRFVRARLKKQDLQPSARSAPPTLVRRLYLTLIGMPPTVPDLERWLTRYEEVDDPSVVTSALVDHLLASDHFGERWARHWMDWIRYAESHGSEGDPAIHNAWVYRDYLIRALNADIPYTQLIREHVAGDLLESPRVNAELGINESIAATAHWRMVFHGFAPTDALDEKVRFVDDQLNTFSKAFLGLTVSCARCHHHKFDPISQHDYYALFGVLAACRPGRTAIDLPERQATNRDALAALKPQIRTAIAAAWHNSLESLPERLGDRALVADQPPAVDSVLYPISLLQDLVDVEMREGWARLSESIPRHAAGKRDVKQQEFAVLAKWNLAEGDHLADWISTGIGLKDQPSKPGEFAISPEGDAALQGIYPGGVYSHILSNKHAARLTSRDIPLQTESEVWLRVIGDGGASTRYVVQDYPRNGTVYPVRKLKPRWSWQRFDLSYWTGDQTHLEIVTARDAPLLVEERDRSWFGVSQVRLVEKGASAPDSSPGYLIALAQTAEQMGVPSSCEELARLYQSAIRTAIANWLSDQASDAQAELLDDCLRSKLLPNSLANMPDVARLVGQYRSLEAGIPVATRVGALEETSGRTQHLYVRGNHRNPSEIVPRRFLEAIDANEYKNQNSGRLQLAEDLLREDNPLTRRVIVNRIWHHLFGRGIVATPDNMGRMGEQPTHPELLDWLASRFPEDGWSLKKLVRRIVMSETWQQSAQPSEAARQIDPNNLYLSHANLRRLEAEAIRDSLLAVSGELNRKRFGPSVKGDSDRRSVYVRVIRNTLDPFLRSFDFPEPFSATGRRDVTNVPAQSLTMMNDPLVARWAGKLASSILVGERQATGDASDKATLRRLYLTLFSRLPDASETGEVLAYLSETRKAHVETRKRREQLAMELANSQQSISAIRETATQRIALDPSTGKGTSVPAPIASWDFEEDLRDSVGTYHGELHGNARLQEGALIVGEGSYVTTGKLLETLQEKTLEAWLRLDDLTQQGGGVISLQTSNGAVFDAIVFGEMQSRHWMAGSNHFARTKSFEGPAEKDATGRSVHLAIAYHDDGRIVGYRDGVPYGNPYKSQSPVTFEANDAVISFGLRHLPAGGNRLLRGRIERAAIYNRALTAAEVATSFEQAGGTVSRQHLLAAMNVEEREKLLALEHRRAGLQSSLQSLGPQQEPAGLAAWTEVTRAMLLLKEFIYVP